MNSTVLNTIKYLLFKRDFCRGLDVVLELWSLLGDPVDRLPIPPLCGVVPGVEDGAVQVGGGGYTSRVSCSREWRVFAKLFLSLFNQLVMVPSLESVLNWYISLNTLKQEIMCQCTWCCCMPWDTRSQRPFPSWSCCRNSSFPAGHRPLCHGPLLPWCTKGRSRIHRLPEKWPRESRSSLCCSCKGTQKLNE